MKTSVKNIIQTYRVKTNNSFIINVIIIVVVVIIASFGGSGSGFVL